MASVTLVESAKLAQDELVAGIIEEIVTVNQMFELLRFDGIDGNSLAFNRENTLGAAGVGGVGTSITTGVVNPITGGSGGKAAATFTKVNFNLTTILGDAEVNGLIQATRSGDGNDQRATQVASKAKNIGQQYQHMFINGTGAGDQFNGLINLCPAGQTVDVATPSPNGENLSFARLDEVIDLVKDKNGQVDYLVMNERTIRAYKALLRALGGAGINATIQLPSGSRVNQYSGIPILRNDYIPVDQTFGAATTATTVFAGTLDDGSRSQGIAGMTAATESGIRVVEVGEAEDRDESITRIKWYSGLALFSTLGIACLPGVLD